MSPKKFILIILFSLISRCDAAEELHTTEGNNISNYSSYWSERASLENEDNVVMECIGNASVGFVQPSLYPLPKSPNAAYWLKRTKFEIKWKQWSVLEQCLPLAIRESDKKEEKNTLFDEQAKTILLLQKQLKERDDYIKLLMQQLTRQCQLPVVQNQIQRQQVPSQRQRVNGWVCTKTLKEHTKKVISIAFNAENKCLISGDEDSKIKCWHTSSWQCKWTSNNEEVVKSIDISKDGKRLATTTAKQIKIWNIVTGQCVRVLQHKTFRDFQHIFFFDDDKQIGFVGFYVNRGYKTNAACLLSSGSFGEITGWQVGLLASNYDHTLFATYNTSNGNTYFSKEKLNFSGAYSAIKLGTQPSCYAFSPRTPAQFASGIDKEVRIYNLETSQKVATINWFSGHVVSLAFSQDGERLAVACNKDISVWNTSNWEREVMLTGHDDKVNKVIFLDDFLLVSASSDKTIKVWNYSNDEEKKG